MNILIQEMASLGVLDDATTNPSLVSKPGRIFGEALVDICNLVDGPISGKVGSLRTDDI